MTLQPSAIEDRRPRNVADLLARAAAVHPDRPAVISNAGMRNWAELNAAADLGVQRLWGFGLGRGDRVIVSLPTGADIIAAMFAVARAGLIAVPIDPARTEIGEIADRVGARAAICEQPGAAQRHWLRGADVESWWTEGARAGRPEARSTPSASGALGGGEDIVLLVRAAVSEHPVMISHRAVLAAVEAITGAPGLALRSEDRALMVLPLYHLAGWVTAFLPLAASGASAVIPDLPEQSGQWIDAVLAAVRTHKATVIPAAPGLYRRLRAAQNVERSLATVRLMTSGASPLHPDDFAAIRTHTGQPVWEGYGVAEASSVVATTLMTSAPRAGSVGRPLPGIEVRIVGDADDADEFGDPIEPAGEDAGRPMVREELIAEVPGDGEVGRIAVRGATLFSGYWPDGHGGPDAHGWFVTGDVGYLDDAGELHLVDRAAEFVTVAGFTVYPREVEEVLAAHPYVRDAAVIGVPGRAGETVIAVLVPQRGTHPTQQDLDDFVAPRLALFKRPIKYRLVERLPRTEVGRLDRDAVRRNYLADPDPDVGSPVRLAVAAAPATDAATVGDAPQARPAPVARVGPDAEEDLF